MGRTTMQVGAARVGANPLSAGCAGTARSLAGLRWAQCTLSSVVLPRARPDHARFRISANRCAILHPEPTHLMLPLHLAPDMQTGGRQGPVDKGTGRSVWPPGPGPCHFKRETAGSPWVGSPGWAASRATIAHCDLSTVDLGASSGNRLVHIRQGLPFFDTSLPLHMGRPVDPDA